MTVAFALLTAASAIAGPPPLDHDHLPPLPERGLARQTKTGVELQTMRGHPLGVIRRLDLAPDKATSSGLLMRDRRGRLFAIDFGARRVRRVFERPSPVRGCRLTDARPGLQLLACKSTIKTRSETGELRIVARAPGKIGHWVRAAWAPRGNVFFAQWSAECEIPVAFRVVGGKMYPFGSRAISDAPESVALGWLPNGSTVVHFPKGACGSSHRVPGIYIVPQAGKPRLLLRTPGFGHYMMWGG